MKVWHIKLLSCELKTAVSDCSKAANNFQTDWHTSRKTFEDTGRHPLLPQQTVYYAPCLIISVWLIWASKVTCMSTDVDMFLRLKETTTMKCDWIWIFLFRLASVWSVRKLLSCCDFVFDCFSENFTAQFSI